MPTGKTAMLRAILEKAPYLLNEKGGPDKQDVLHYAEKYAREDTSSMILQMIVQNMWASARCVSRVSLRFYRCIYSLFLVVTEHARLAEDVLLHPYY